MNVPSMTPTHISIPENQAHILSNHQIKMTDRALPKRLAYPVLGEHSSSLRSAQRSSVFKSPSVGIPFFPSRAVDF